MTWKVSSSHTYRPSWEISDDEIVGPTTGPALGAPNAVSVSRRQA